MAYDPKADFDLASAKNKVNYYTSNKYRNPDSIGGGRTLSDDEFTQLGQRVGYTGGVIDDDLLNRAYGEIDTYAQQQGWDFQPSWQRPKEPPTAPPPSPPPPGPEPTGEVPPSPPPAAPSSPLTQAGAAPTANPMQQAAQDALMQLLGQSQNAATLGDPTIAPVSDAYRSSRQRGYERELNALAEMAAANGTIGSGGFDTDAFGALTGASRDVANFDANLVYNENNQRRQQLMQALQLATQTGDSGAARQLQMQLAQMDNAMQQQGINLNRQLGQGGLDLQRLLGTGAQDLQRQGIDLSRLLGTGDLELRNKTLGQQGALGRGDLGLRLLQSLMQNDQFFSGLGLNAAQLQALLNQSAVTSIL